MTAPTLTFNGRLPGVDCQAALPPAPTTIRLDVAGFVGFAERGPVHLPVAVEDVNQFRAVFGGDFAVARDGSVPVYAYLPSAVQAFFDNGGRRCYVVRVAGANATAARWAVPGLRSVVAAGTVSDDVGGADVYVQAAWPGRWSKGFSVGTQLSALPLPLPSTGTYRRRGKSDLNPPPGTLPPGTLVLTAESCLGLATGDLIALQLEPPYPSLYLRVATVDIDMATVSVDAEVPFLSGVSSPSEPAEASGAPLLLGRDALAALPEKPLVVHAGWLLRMDLVIRQDLADSSQIVERINDLRFNAGSSRYWLDALQPAGDVAPDQSRSMLLRADPGSVVGGLDVVFVPAGMDEQGGPAEFADEVSGAPPMLGELEGGDALDTFDPAALFLDDQLSNDTVGSLIADADALTIFATADHPPPPLRGIHALLGIDEVAMVSVPDAVHVGWSPPLPAPAPSPAPPAEPAPPPDFSQFHCCAVAAPASADTNDVAAKSRDDDNAVASLPSLDDPTGYDGTSLLRVQTALVVMCAARADQLAVLSAPRHFDSIATLGWLQQLTRWARSGGPAPIRPDADSDSTDLAASRTVFDPLSFASFWHPWVRLVEPTTPELAPLRDQPADGVVCGTIAARELSRGVWLAPANMTLRGPVALAPVLSTADTVNLFNAHVNVLRQRPGTFSALSAHTLTNDPVLLQISVRRLLILLRKIALVEGNRYVFAVNNDRFRQLVRMRFERILAALTGLGALAAYQVATDGGINTAEDLDAGRLIVRLLVAPTSPIEFITITLVRAGEGLLDVVVG